MGAKPEVTVLGESDGEASLLDILDHVLNAGVVVHGSLVISLAGVDLVYVGLNVILTSVETAMRNMKLSGERRKGTGNGAGLRSGKLI